MPRGNIDAGQPAVDSHGTAQFATAPTIRDLDPVLAAGRALLASHIVCRHWRHGHARARTVARRLHDRFGSVEKLPAIRLLAIDTDTESLAERTQEGDDSGLTPRNSLALPLRRSEEYRGGSVKLLEWMSRRWLYNIPRSLQTEGLRPLGRLRWWIMVNNWPSN